MAVIVAHGIRDQMGNLFSNPMSDMVFRDLGYKRLFALRMYFKIIVIRRN